jgi:ribosomal protein L21E
MKSFLSLFILLVIFLKPLHAVNVDIIKDEEVVVHFEESLRDTAGEVKDIYPTIKAELEKTFRLKLDFKPIIVLTKDRRIFQKMAVNDLIVAFAVPQKNLIVIDSSKMRTHPFTMEITLRHELCHLLLYHYVRGGDMPKWLDEGISQWVSGGIAEIITSGKGAVLKQATLSERFISLRDLTKKFPEDEKSLLLAYEESKSIVEYMNKEFGTNGILQLLNNLREGDEMDIAIQKSFSIPLEELEKRWHGYLKRRITWFTYLSDYLYEILFFLAALITIYGFIRLLMKRRAYKDEEDLS